MNKQSYNQQIVDPKNISVVVQGAVDKLNTPICIESIRKNLPGAEIILSTWEGSSVEDLNYDILVLNKDPEGLYCSIKNCYDNTNRQIVSTLAGTKVANREFVLKIRSDCLLKSNKFLSYFTLYHHRNQHFELFKQRILACTLFTKRFLDYKSKIPTPFHLSDWFIFGLKEDLLFLWDIPTIADADYMGYNECIKDSYEGLWFTNKYTPEQYIFFNCVSKKYKVKFSDMLDFNSHNISFSENIFANNFILISPKNLDMLILKEPYKSQIKNYEAFIEKQPLCLYDEEGFEVLYKNYVLEKNNEV